MLENDVIESSRLALAQPAAMKPPEQWRLQPRGSLRRLLIGLFVLVLLLFSAKRTEIDRMLLLSAEAVGSALGVAGPSQVADGVRRVSSSLWPPQLSERREVARIEGFDRKHLPLGSHLEQEQSLTRSLDPTTLQVQTQVVAREVLVQPLGYLWRVIGLMFETVEMAVWGTLVALLAAFPLAYFGARNYAPHPLLHTLARGTSSLLRSVPDLISALFLVLAFGFGPIAGVLALGAHSAGFLGKFFAESIENAERAPQDALRAAGARDLQILRYAVWPAVLPSVIGQVQYILERNVRTATVIGIVGAGGIGQELKGRFEMFDFGHVATLLLAIFVSVVLLEHLAGRLRARFI
jgi:phosphonate transport system permease protein